MPVCITLAADVTMPYDVLQTSTNTSPPAQSIIDGESNVVGASAAASSTNCNLPSYKCDESIPDRRFRWPPRHVVRNTDVCGAVHG